jgi:F-type H+-transporting ATPase subunit delta
MRIQPVAYRYARSLLGLALEQGQLKEVHADVVLLANTCAQNDDLRLLLKSPVLRADVKRKVLDKVFGAQLGKLSKTFVNVLVRKGREALLPDITMAFQEIYRKHENIIVCKVTSAVALTEVEREQVRTITGARFPGMTVQVEELIDPSIIGGGIIQVGDLQWDASVKNKLQVIHRTFTENPYVAKI